jgi:hypothetical protein
VGAARAYEPLTVEDLKWLRAFALQEHAAYFVRNPHLTDAYGYSLQCICLCQGAASHYLNTNVGVKDYDIWFFHTEHEFIRLNPRGRLTKNRPSYKGKPIDLIRRSVPKSICDAHTGSPQQIVMTYMRQRNTVTKRLFLKKAIIGLYPADVFATVLWPGTPPTRQAARG